MRRALATGRLQLKRGLSTLLTGQGQAANESVRSWKFWVPVTIGGTCVGATAGLLATSEHPASSAKLVVQFPLRLARDVVAAVAIIAGVV